MRENKYYRTLKSSTNNIILLFKAKKLILYFQNIVLL
jgi:hypothetical protein